MLLLTSQLPKMPANIVGAQLWPWVAVHGSFPSSENGASMDREADQRLGPPQHFKMRIGLNQELEVKPAISSMELVLLYSRLRTLDNYNARKSARSWDARRTECR